MDNIELEKRIVELEKEIKNLNSFATIPLSTEGAFRNRLNLDFLERSVLVLNALKTTLSALIGVISGDGLGGFTATVPLSGTHVYYVSDTSGGLVTRKLTFTNGILTSQT